MISILIIEDNKEKLSAIKAGIEATAKHVNGRIETASCLIEARDWLLRTQFDVLLLDLMLPNRKDDPPEEDGGVSLLEELAISRTLIKPGYIIGLSSYEKIVEQQKTAFSNHLWTLLKFDLSDQTWADQLRQHLEYVIKSHQYFTENRRPAYDYDVGLIVALPETELHAVLNSGSTWTARRYPTSFNTYHETKRRLANSKEVRIIAAACPQMGNVASCALTQELISLHRPRIVLLLGICGGSNQDDQNILDVVISDEVILHDSGKIKEKDGRLYLHPDPKSLQIAPAIKSLLQHPDFTSRVKSSLQRRLGLGPSEEVKCHNGPIASGSCVIAAKPAVEEIRHRIRKLQGIEMEGYGFAYACEHSALPRPEWLIIKSICDFADANKGNEYQSRSAAVSMAYADHLIEFIYSRQNPDEHIGL